MRLRFILVVILALFLAACTPTDGGEGALSNAEETIQPALTEVATAVATVLTPGSPACVDLPEVTTAGKEGVTVPENAVAVFQKTGGFAGINETTVIYADGFIENDKNESYRAPQQAVEAMVTTAADIGFFDLDQNYVPKNHCCDFFNYSLTIRDCDQVHTVVTADEVPNSPAELKQLISTVESLISNLSAAVPPSGTVVIDELTPEPPTGDEQTTRPAPGTPG